MNETYLTLLHDQPVFPSGRHLSRRMLLSHSHVGLDLQAVVTAAAAAHAFELKVVVPRYACAITVGADDFSLHLPELPARLGQTLRPASLEDRWLTLKWRPLKVFSPLMSAAVLDLRVVAL